MPKVPQGQRRPADVMGNAVLIAKFAMGEIKEMALKQPTMRKTGLVEGARVSTVSHTLSAWRFCAMPQVRGGYDA